MAEMVESQPVWTPFRLHHDQHVDTIEAVKDLTDEELLARYRAVAGASGSERFLNELFSRHHSKVAAWCYRMTGDRDSAADLSQDIFIKVYQHLDSFQGTARFSTWLYSITRNHCLNDWKARANRPQQFEREVLLELPDEKAESIENILERVSSAENARKLLAETLDETELKVMTLHYRDEISLQGVSKVLGLTNASGAKAYVVSARRKLAVAVERWKARQ